MPKKSKERFSWRSCCEGRRNEEKLEVAGLGFPGNVDFVSGSDPATRFALLQAAEGDDSVGRSNG